MCGKALRYNFLQIQPQTDIATCTLPLPNETTGLIVSRMLATSVCVCVCVCLLLLLVPWEDVAKLMQTCKVTGSYLC